MRNSHIKFVFYSKIDRLASYAKYSCLGADSYTDINIQTHKNSSSSSVIDMICTHGNRVSRSDGLPDCTGRGNAKQTVPVFDSDKTVL
jgi:hypothetical protein